MMAEVGRKVKQVNAGGDHYLTKIIIYELTGQTACGFTKVIQLDSFL